MKMNYLLDKQSFFSNNHYSKPPRSKVGLFLVTLVLLVVVTVAFKFITRPVVTSVTPVVSTVQNLSLVVSNNIPFIMAKSSLVKENNDLKLFLKESNLALVQAKNKIEELEVLATEVNYQENSPQSIVTAKVLVHSGFLDYDTLIIDKGKDNSSLKLGDTVVTGQNIFLGEVVQIFAKTAKVKLYSSASRKTNVQIGQTNIPGLATGLSGGNFVVTLPINALVKDNDIVRKVVDDQEYILGLVGLIEKTEQVPFQKVYFKVPINIYELRFVSIISR